MKDIKIETFNIPDITIDLEEFNRRVNYEIARAFGIPSHYFDTVTKPPRWHRRDKEAIIHWGKRLEKMGLLDNPAIRWEYQKYILSTPLRIIRQWVKSK